MTLRTLNYGNYGTFLIMGNAGFCPSTVVGTPSPPPPGTPAAKQPLGSLAAAPGGGLISVRVYDPEGPYTLPMELGTKKTIPTLVLGT